MSTAAARGLVIPDDLSIIGYNDIPVVSRLPVPLTTIREPFNHIARGAIDSCSTKPPTTPAKSAPSWPPPPSSPANPPPRPGPAEQAEQHPAPPVGQLPVPLWPTEVMIQGGCLLKALNERCREIH